MKKSLIFSSLTVAAILAGAGLNFHPVSAKTVTEKWGNAYTLEEVKTMYQEYKTKMTETCGEDDWACLRTFFDNMKAEDPKYGALNTYMSSPFYVTKIDPETGNLHLYYRDYSLNRHMMGMMREEEHHALTEMYIGWLEPDTSISKFPELITKDATNKNLHVIVRAEAEANGGFWFPSEKEVMISAPGADLPNNETRKIIFWLHMGSPSFFNNSDYSTCYETGYQPGMECRMLFTEDGGYIYLPYSTEEVSDPDVKSDDQTEDQTDDQTEGKTEDKTEDTETTTDPGDSDKDESDTETDAGTDKENDQIQDDQTQTDQQIVENNITNVTVAPSVIRETVFRDRYITIFKTVEEQGNKQEEDSSKKPDQTIQPESNKTQDSLSSSTSVDLPESGKYEKETIFPWWFIIVLAVVDAIIMWFFWPKREKSQKIAKKS